MIGPMRVIMEDGQLQTIEQVRQFLEGSEAVEFKGLTAREKYYWIEGVLIRFSYPRLKRAEKGVIREYIRKGTGYSRAQVTRLISRYNRSGELRRKEYRRHRFKGKYTHQDMELLARTDELHGWLSGPATRRILEREWQVFGDDDYRNISRISVSHPRS